MIRHLLLLRHAAAAEKLPTQNDFDRPLTEHGIQQAVKVGAYMNSSGWVPQLIITSPAKRTLFTAKIVADAVRYPEAEIVPETSAYNGSVLQLYHALQQVNDGFTHVLLVAHNPGISYLGEWLTKNSDSELLPGGLLHIEFDVQRWSELREGSGKWLSKFQP
jgi:phosphohistidine phosphatase